MALTEREKELLLNAIAADLAKRRLKRGVKLNYLESVALITSRMMEGASEGMSEAQIADLARSTLRKDQVMCGIAEMLREVQVEADFPEGTRLVIVPFPITG
ncbi:urease subunit gamma [Paenibacillus sp. 1011MAR3C5]|uniref:urease subunit gamma n=1 Tax=Paenibacillus sp. 1011MAR3C5 TaxID=1675787 RepID=UPI000E6C0621|nr:urease subunit gamma [Paenibacillus sp. 1011MAR3C5]RJE90974.1 urease subunit gamma [Paenibacillus sp. 1011MAR3C5]